MGFRTRRKKVMEEWLYQVATDNERPIFERSGSSFSFDIRFESKSQEQFFDFLGKATLPNRLFLSECRERNVKEHVPGAGVILDIVQWFQDSLLILSPQGDGDRLVRHFFMDSEFSLDLGRFLKSFDTGVESIELDHVDYRKVAIPSDLRQEIESGIAAGKVAVVVDPDNVHWLLHRTREEQ